MHGLRQITRLYGDVGIARAHCGNKTIVADRGNASNGAFPSQSRVCRLHFRSQLQRAIVLERHGLTDKTGFVRIAILVQGQGSCGIVGDSNVQRVAHLAVRRGADGERRAAFADCDDVECAGAFSGRNTSHILITVGTSPLHLLAGIARIDLHRDRSGVAALVQREVGDRVAVSTKQGNAGRRGRVVCNVPRLLRIGIRSCQLPFGTGKGTAIARAVNLRPGEFRAGGFVDDGTFGCQQFLAVVGDLRTVCVIHLDDCGCVGSAFRSINAVDVRILRIS